MMETLQIGKAKVTWLDGGVTHLDGGAMFGVVPKALWSKKYAVNENNQIVLRTDPLLIQIEGKNILIESGIGNGMLDEKQKRNYGVTAESKVIESLAVLNITPEDIDYVLMTHLHFDHVVGLTTLTDNEYTSVFPNATIFASQIEWDEMRSPNVRSRNTYWEKNWKSIEKQVKTFDSQLEVMDGITMVHTGGHSNGHAIVIIKSEGETMIHLADLLPTHAHHHFLWVLAYDDYPMQSIAEKQKWMKFGVENDAWHTFYHDAVYRAVKWTDKGEIVKKVERNK